MLMPILLGYPENDLKRERLDWPRQFPMGPKMCVKSPNMRSGHRFFAIAVNLSYDDVRAYAGFDVGGAQS